MRAGCRYITHMDTKKPEIDLNDTARIKISDGLARLRAGDSSAVNDVVEAFNARKVDRRTHPGTYIKGWEIIGNE